LIKHLASFERNPVKSARKPNVPAIGGDNRSLAMYKPESKGKSAKYQHDERFLPHRPAATFRPMDENR